MIIDQKQKGLLEEDDYKETNSLVPANLTEVKNVNEMYKIWSQEQTTPNTMKMLELFKPDMEKAITAAGGQVSPLTTGQAKRKVLDAVKSYSPERGANIKTWVAQHLQGLNRDMRKNKFSVKVPEEKARDAARIQSFIAEEESKVNRELSDSEVADKLGVSLKAVRVARLGSSPEKIDSYVNLEGVEDEMDENKLIMDMVYYSLNPTQQVIMEYGWGYNDVPKAEGKEIAKKLKISPAAVSQNIAKIREMLQDAQRVI